MTTPMTPRKRSIRPQIHLSTHEEHEPRLHALAERLNREPDDLVKHALGDLPAAYEAKAVGGLLATQPSPDTDPPLVHARRLSDPRGDAALRRQRWTVACAKF